MQIQPDERDREALGIFGGRLAKETMDLEDKVAKRVVFLKSLIWKEEDRKKAKVAKEGLWEIFMEFETQMMEELNLLEWALKFLWL